MRKLFDDLSRTPRGSPHNRKSVRTNSPETKRNKKGLEARQDKIDKKGQSIIRNIALKNLGDRGQRKSSSRPFCPGVQRCACTRGGKGVLGQHELS